MKIVTISLARPLVLGVVRVTPGKAEAQGAHMRGRLKGNLKKTAGGGGWVGRQFEYLSFLLCCLVVFSLFPCTQHVSQVSLLGLCANLSCHLFPFHLPPLLVLSSREGQRVK